MKKIKRLFLLIIIVLICMYVYKNTNIKDKILKIMYPIKYSEHVEKYSEEFGVDKLLIYSIIKAESNFNPNVKSNSGAIGLMQLMTSTATEIDSNIDDQQLYDEETNIKIGIEYFAKLLKHYNCIELALVAYNAGMGNVDKWLEEETLKEDGSNIENVPFKETNNYVRKILRDYEIYKKLYE